MNGSSRAQWALTITRIMLGIIFVAHGAQKVLGVLGGPGLAGFVAWTTKLGVPFYLGYLAAFAEFLGGILLLLGIYAELGALMCIPLIYSRMAEAIGILGSCSDSQLSWSCIA